MLKHFFLVIFSFCICSLLMAACGGETSKKTADPTEPVQTKSYENDPADLVIFGAPGAPEDVWNEKYGDALKKKFPNYKFTYLPKNNTNSLEKMITTGSQVDLILDSVGNAVNSVIATGSQFDLSDLVKKHNVDMNRFEPATIDAVKQFGGLYGFPVSNGGLVLYYNKDIFDKFGAAYPKDGMTWEDATQLGKKLTRNDNGRQFIGLAPSINHVLSMNSYSLPLVDKATGKAAINNDKYKKIVETLAIAPTQIDGYKERVAALKRTFNNDDFMKDQSIAIFIMNFGLQNYKEFETFNWDMAALPVFKDTPGVGSQPYPDFLFITNTSNYKDQAMEVLQYLTSDDYQMANSKKGYIPVLKNESIKKAFAQETKYKDKNVRNAVFFNKPASPITRTKDDLKVNLPLLAHITKVILGQEDLNTALNNAEEEGNKAIEAKK